MSPAPCAGGITASTSAPSRGAQGTEVFLPALGEIGLEAGLALRRWGWYPSGGGEVEATIIPTRGPGTLLFLAVPGRAGFSSLGRRGVRAEAVADEAVDSLLAYRASGALVDDHLADQLVPFLALGREGATLTCPSLSPHLGTIAWVVQQFLPVGIELDDARPARARITPPPAP